MKAEMEKQKREYQDSSAEVSLKHSKELKDLGKMRTWWVCRVCFLSIGISLSVCLSNTELSYSQKLIVEHERYQDLMHKYQRMQEDYEKQLRAAEERKTQALENLAECSEAKLQEKIQDLAQVGQQEHEEEAELCWMNWEGPFDFDMFYFS